MEFQGEGLNVYLARLVYLQVHLNVFVYLPNEEKLINTSGDK